MEPRQIHYFQAIAEEEHFGRASERLRIAQPALSRQVKLLEAELGVDLFERLPRGVRLTAAGRVFLERCREISALTARAVGEARAAASGSIGTLKIGFIEVAAWQGIIPDTLRRFRAAYPDVELKLAAMPSTEQVEAVREGRIDAGFAYNASPGPDLDVLVLERHPVLLALPGDHPLARVERIRLADLAAQPFIGFRRQASERYHDDLTRAFADAGVEPDVIQEMDSEPDMLALVNAGVGLAFANACQRWRTPPGLAFRPVVDIAVELELSLIHRRDNSAPALAHLVHLLKFP